jgi:Protein of unknown function (DUF3313)
MNTSITLNQPAGRCWLKPLTGLTVAGLLALGLIGCATTKHVSETSKDFSGFLGDAQEYALLQKGEGTEANFVWVDKNAPWKTYTNVCIMPIELWASDDPDSPFKNMSHDDQERLVSFFHTALAETLHKSFAIVEEPGPNTIVIHAAITEARPSKPVLNLVSSVYPAALVVSFAKQAVTGTGLGVGAVRVEGYFTDGGTGQRVAEGVDARAGTKAWRTKFNGTWGDVNLCFEWWSGQVVTRFKNFEQGNFSPKDLPDIQ